MANSNRGSGSRHDTQPSPSRLHRTTRPPRHHRRTNTIPEDEVGEPANHCGYQGPSYNSPDSSNANQMITQGGIDTTDFETGSNTTEAGYGSDVISLVPYPSIPSSSFPQRDSGPFNMLPSSSAPYAPPAPWTQADDENYITYSPSTMGILHDENNMLIGGDGLSQGYHDDGDQARVVNFGDPPFERRWSIQNNQGSTERLVDLTAPGDMARRYGENQTLPHDDEFMGANVETYLNSDEEPWNALEASNR